MKTEIKTNSRELNSQLANEWLGENGAFLMGVEDYLDFPIPFVESLGRGKYNFIVDGSEYALYKGTYNKAMYNSWGGQYTQKQGTWGVKLVKGKDKYKLEITPDEYWTTKADIIDKINRDILEYEVSKVLKKHKKEVELADDKDFEKEYKESDKDEKIKILEIQIDWMSTGLNQTDAMARVFGYVPIKQGAYTTRYILKKILDDRRSKSIAQSIRSRMSASPKNK